jgi:hypothetical protein
MFDTYLVINTTYSHSKQYINKQWHETDTHIH